MSEQYVGEIRLFSFGRVPTGWQACNGQQLSISQYQPLYTLIGTTYGGDGISNFNVPDLRGRVPLAAGSGSGQPTYVLGQAGARKRIHCATRKCPPTATRWSRPPMPAPL